MKKKVLVIGANGFTGRRILNDLSRNDEYIVTGCSLHDDIAPDSGNYRFISADICQMGEQSALFREVRLIIAKHTVRRQTVSMSMLWDNWHSDAKHPLHALYIYLLTLYLMEIQGSFIQKKTLLTPSTIMGQPN